MALEFVETVGIKVPNVEKQLSSFKEHEFTESHGLIVAIAAIHEGVTNNFNHYTEETLEGSIESWTKPYPKPVLLNHDPHSEPLGRVMNAAMAKESDGTPFTQLQAAITDPVAIEKVLDQRYLTGSIGGKSEKAVCSVCESDWARESMCKHTPGRTYKGKMAWLNREGLTMKEYSFVNVPSDEQSAIIGKDIDKAEESENWNNNASFFILNMEEKQILKCQESSEAPKDVLSTMEKKDVAPFYQGVKGSFLLASAGDWLQENDPNSEENEMAKDASDSKVDEEDESILDVTGKLSEDLYSDSKEEEEELKEEDSKEEDTETEAASEEAAEEESGEESEETASSDEGEEVDRTSEENKDETSSDSADEEVEDSEGSADKSEEEDETSEEASDDSEESASDSDQAEGQSEKSKDVDPDDSSGAPANRESDNDDDNTEESNEDDSELSGTEENEHSGELTVDELQAEVERLSKENEALKGALHRTLAERVVDAKIVLGLHDVDSRAELVAEHSERTASSLGDSLRDLAQLPSVVEGSIPPSALSVDEDIEVVSSNEKGVTMDEEDSNADSGSDKEPIEVLEDFFVDVLTDRRKL